MLLHATCGDTGYANASGHLFVQPSNTMKLDENPEFQKLVLTAVNALGSKTSTVQQIRDCGFSIVSFVLDNPDDSFDLQTFWGNWKRITDGRPLS